MPAIAAKILLQHIALAHKDWLPSGAMPLGHLNEAQAALHTLIGVFPALLTRLSHIILWRLFLTMVCCAHADGMRSYFLPPRFYSTEFPFTGLKLKMVGLCVFLASFMVCVSWDLSAWQANTWPELQMRIAQDRAKQTRRITIAFHKLFRLSQVWVNGNRTVTLR